MSTEMRTSGQVKHQLRQVLFRHLQKELRDNFKQTPESCQHNHPTLIGSTTVSVGVCRYEGHKEGSPRGKVCDTRVSGCVNQARACKFWVSPKSKEEIKAEFRDLLGGDRGRIAARYPDVAALMWVLGDDDFKLTAEDVLADANDSTGGNDGGTTAITKVSIPPKEGSIPAILEFHVPPETAPYLVTSNSGLLWIVQPHPGNLIKAAIRSCGEDLGPLFWGMSEAMIEASREYEWGSIQPFTKEGVAAACAHVKDYDIGSLEILANKVRPAWLNSNGFGCPVRVCPWVPERYALVVPAKRELLGILVRTETNLVASVIHNASRGFAVAMGE